MVHCWYDVNLSLDLVQKMEAVQLRMARAAIGWGVRELAEKAGVTANTVSRIELGADAKQSTIDAIRRALEAAGVEFINGEKPGVRVSRDFGTAPPAAAAPSKPASKAKAAGKLRSRAKGGGSKS
jgi:transcriptional regulator with XRE-family HTH domain